MRKNPTLLVSGLALLLAGATIAEASNVRYKWRDGEGNLHYSDALPAEAGVYGYEVVNAQGIVIKQVAPAMSKEERAAANAAAKADREKADAADRERRADQQLLAANPTEADLLASQKQHLENLDQQMQSMRSVMESLERNLADLLGRAADAEAKEVAVPAELNRRIADVRGKIEQQHVAIQAQGVEREKTVARFTAELDRYRILREAESQR